MNTYLEFVSIYLSYPFVIAIIALVLSKLLIEKIMPGKKQSIIEKFVELKNLVKEIIFVHDRIVYSVRNYDIKNPNSLKNEIDRISFLINEKIPIVAYGFDSEIETYFSDKKLAKVHDEYKIEFKKIHDFFVSLPATNDIFLKKIEEIENLDFKYLVSVESKLLDAILKAKSVKILHK